MPAKLGVTDGKLAPCPSRPNCVSSQSAGNRHFIEPLHYEGSMAKARERLVTVLRLMERSKLIKVEEDYIHTEFRSRFFRFVDDAEFYFDDDKKIIQIRSASRLGYSDLGVNRKRMERIRVSMRGSKPGMHEVS